MATQPPQQAPALGLPAIHTAILRGCEQPPAIRREGGGVDLEGKHKSSAILGSLTPDSRTSPKHCLRNPGWKLGLQASLYNQSPEFRNHSCSPRQELGALSGIL